MSKTIYWHTAPWCQPCKLLKPVARGIAEDAGARWVEVDVDEQPPLIPESLGVPTAMITSENGEILAVLPPNGITASILRRVLA